jgi:hypothetical protein
VALHNQRLLKALKDDLVSPITGLHIAMRDIGQRLKQAGGAQWMEFFTTHVTDWFAGHDWEAKNRANRRVPGEKEYTHMRQYTIGMYFEFMLTELYQGFIADTNRTSAGYKRLSGLANFQIAMANDVMTFEKEADQGDVHNIVFSIMRHQVLPKETAMRIAVDMHNAVVRDFAYELSRQKVKRLELYGEDLKNWIAGHLQWGLQSKRYNPNLVEVLPSVQQ